MTQLYDLPTDHGEHVESMFGGFCAYCSMEMTRESGYNKWADGTDVAKPKYQPSIIVCPTCGGSGMIDNPNKGQPYP